MAGEANYFGLIYCAALALKSLPTPALDDIEKALFRLLHVCCLHLHESNLRMPYIEASHEIIYDCISWTGYTHRIITFWNEDAQTMFLSLRGVHSAERGSPPFARGECSYSKCRLVPKVLSRIQASFSEIWSLLRDALYWVLDRCECLRAEGLAASLECECCGGTGESTEHIFFHCLVVQPLCELDEHHIFCILQGRFFTLDVSFVCSNVHGQEAALCSSVFASCDENGDINDEGERCTWGIVSLFPAPAEGQVQV